MGSLAESSYSRGRENQRTSSSRRARSLQTAARTTTTRELPKLRRLLSRFLPLPPSRDAPRERTANPNVNRQAGPNPTPPQDRKLPFLKVAIPPIPIFKRRFHKNQPLATDSPQSQWSTSTRSQGSRSEHQSQLEKFSNPQMNAFPFPTSSAPLPQLLSPPPSRSRNFISPMEKEAPWTRTQGSPDGASLGQTHRLPFDVLESLGGIRELPRSALPPTDDSSSSLLSLPSISGPAGVLFTASSSLRWRPSLATSHFSDWTAEESRDGGPSSHRTSIHSEVSHSRHSLSRFSDWTTSTDETDFIRSSYPSPPPKFPLHSVAESLERNVFRPSPGKLLKSSSDPCIRREVVKWDQITTLVRNSTLVTKATQTSDLISSGASLSSAEASVYSNSFTNSEHLRCEYSKLVSGHTADMRRNQLIISKTSESSVKQRLEAFELAGRLLKEMND